MWMRAFVLELLEGRAYRYLCVCGGGGGASGMRVNPVDDCQFYSTGCPYVMLQFAGVQGLTVTAMHGYRFIIVTSYLARRQR